MAERPLLTVGSLLTRLAQPAGRHAAAAHIARHWGGETLLIFVLDEDLDLYRPAPGFPQTLPGGQEWREFLSRCKEEAAFRMEVSYPVRDRLVPAVAFGMHGAVVALLGGNPSVSRAALEESGISLLCALLKAEAAAVASDGRAAAAGEASRRANLLAAALDQARSEIHIQATQLRDALDEASRLNSDLNALNDTLEQRVAERSRQLEEEVAERRKVEEAFAQAQKMEVVGQLTGGIAHDFNNLLTVIIGGLDRIGRQLPELPAGSATAKIDRAKDMALQGAHRAATLTHRLLAFARRQPLDPKPVDANKLVAGFSEILQRSLGETIELETVLAAGLWRTQVDVNQLENALLNLAVNARDAMPQGGKLTIDTANAHIDEAYARRAAEMVAPGQYVQLAITDTGTGMDKSTLERVFEPFFTTKAAGLGTGLGLSQVYGFVRQSAGHIKVYSEPGEGTTVKIYLPRHLGVVDAEAEMQARPLEKPSPASDLTILVVEDDPALREYATECLRELGYQVLEAEKGRTALQLLDKFPQIVLLFTDVVLPDGMNGRRLADEAKARKPGLKVLFTTGYTQNAIVHHGRLDVGVQLISKPYTYSDLAAKIQAVLDQE
jgi:signal transduction histidine kinase/ActR/RegA family two-component response regulator